MPAVVAPRRGARQRRWQMDFITCTVYAFIVASSLLSRSGCRGPAGWSNSLAHVSTKIAACMKPDVGRRRHQREEALHDSTYKRFTGPRYSPADGLLHQTPTRSRSGSWCRKWTHRLRLSPGLGQRLVASLHVAPDMCRPTMAPALAPLPLRRARTTATFLGGWALGGGFPALLHSTHHLPATPV